MASNVVSLNLVGVDTDVDEGGEGATLLLHGEGGVTVALKMTTRSLLDMSTLIDQLALSVVTAQCFARKGAQVTTQEDPCAVVAEPVVVPVYLVREFDILHTKDGGCVLDVNILRGNHVRLALSAAQVESFASQVRERLGSRDVQ